MRSSRSASLPTASRSRRIISKRCCTAKLTPPVRQRETWKSSDRAIRPVPTPNSTRSNCSSWQRNREFPKTYGEEFFKEQGNVHPNLPHLMASLEPCELAHEGSSDIGIDLAVKKDWPVGFPKLRGELVQLL